MNLKRAFVYLSALVGVAGSVYLAGAIRAQVPAPAAPPAAAAGTRPTVAVFNIVDVLRNYNFARAHMALLNNERMSLSKELMTWRADYLKKQQEFQASQVQAVKEGLQKEMTELARKIEDKDREITKVIGEKGSQIIGQIHDHIKTVVDRIALPNGYHIVFAYPEATTADEMNNPQMKELKLRPTAAMPFYVAPQIDITKLVVQTLNAWYEAPKLPPGVEMPGTRPAGAPPTAGSPLPTPGLTPASGMQPR